MIEYYHKRAKEYETIYQKPERQKDLRKLEQFVSEEFKNQNVLEIACGTGYWTTFIAHAALSITALDINAAVIDIAQSKIYNTDKINFVVEDLETYQATLKFDALFGGFICSHILLEKLQAFIQNCFKDVKEEGKVILIDNKYVRGSNTKISRRDDKGNTFQIRSLQSEEQFEVLKNFLTQERAYEILKPLHLDMEWLDFEYFWIMKLTKKKV